MLHFQRQMLVGPLFDNSFRCPGSLPIPLLFIQISLAHTRYRNRLHICPLIRSSKTTLSMLLAHAASLADALFRAPEGKAKPRTVHPKLGDRLNQFLRLTVRSQIKGDMSYLFRLGVTEALYQAHRVSS